ncbi:MAG: hypothetical protein RSA57_09400 [Cetobacterium sp.]|uniref:hypothetical protein n=1 Tax=Cetobacterium sp. TaxID=2071632 RepID=UPI002FC60631
MKKIIFVFMLLSLLSFSKEYNIGDQITIKISGDITKNEIETAFKDYKINNIKKDENFYIVNFTSYKVGKNEVVIGNKKLNIDIISTINDSENEIYQNLADPNNRYVEKDYPHMFILSGIAGLIAFLTGILMIIVDRARDPYIIFKKRISKINDANWREEISFELRTFIDNTLKTNFLGGEYILKSPIIEEDINFIKKLDYVKFSSNKDGDYLKYRDQAIEIVERLRKELKNNAKL